MDIHNYIDFNFSFLQDEDDFYDYINRTFIPEISDTGRKNVLEEYNKSYTLDFKTSIQLIKYIQICLVNEYGCKYERDFCDMFWENVDSERAIINSYADWFVRKNWFYIYHRQTSDKWQIIKIYRNMAKYNFHKKKYNKLINLYEKLDKKNKQKKTIIKILNDKFDTDIIQNIISAY